MKVQRLAWFGLVSCMLWGLVCWISAGPASAWTSGCGCEGACDTYGCRQIYWQGQPTGWYEECINLSHPPNAPLTRWVAAENCDLADRNFLQDIFYCGEYYDGPSCSELTAMDFCGGLQALEYEGC